MIKRVSPPLPSSAETASQVYLPHPEVFRARWHGGMHFVVRAFSSATLEAGNLEIIPSHRRLRRNSRFWNSGVDGHTVGGRQRLRQATRARYQRKRGQSCVSPAGQLALATCSFVSSFDDNMTFIGRTHCPEWVIQRSDIESQR